MAVFYISSGMDGDFVVSSHQVDFGEDGITEKLVGVVMDMPDGVAVGNGTGVEGSVIATGTPPVILLGHDVERRDQELLELRALPSRNMASNSALAIANLSSASRRGRQVTGGSGIVRMWWTVLWRTSLWTPAGLVRSGNSARMLSIGVPPVTVLTLGTSALAAWAGTDNDVTPSSSRLFRQSTKRPNWERKSTPMMGCVTSAMTNRHVKSRRRPKLKLRGSHP
jgi:hypothetical protein